MLIRTLLLATILFFQINLTGQNGAEEKCGTIDTPDPLFDSVHFENFQRNYTQNKRDEDVTMIPVAARIVRFSHGEGGLDPVHLTEIMDSLNARFVSSNIQFYQCGEPQYVDEGLFFNFDRSIYADSLVTYNVPNVINIYFINKILNDDVTLCGYASFPWNDKDQEYVVVKNSCAMNGSTLAHG